VVSRVTARATHDWGEFLCITPTGKEVTYKGILIHRIARDKKVEEWRQGNIVGELMEQRLEVEARERERIEQDLRVARSIEQTSLPKEVPALESWQIAPYYQPPER
jgi:serine phosphatase RsbU (regulator of sigma subunit)